jgi:hypothetical protein
VDGPAAEAATAVANAAAAGAAGTAPPLPAALHQEAHVARQSTAPWRWVAASDVQDVLAAAAPPVGAVGVVDAAVVVADQVGAGRSTSDTVVGGGDVVWADCVARVAAAAKLAVATLDALGPQSGAGSSSGGGVREVGLDDEVPVTPLDRVLRTVVVPIMDA